MNIHQCAIEKFNIKGGSLDSTDTSVKKRAHTDFKL